MKRSSSKKMIVSVLILVGLCGTLLTSGCAARSEYMEPNGLDMAWDGESGKPYTVSINESTGGIDPKPMWGSQISNTAFTAALTNSLKKTGVFQTVTTGDGADYILDVAILNYDQPWNGANMTVRMETTWKLTNAKTQDVVWSNTFPAAYTANWKSSPTDTGRAKNAQEGAARTTIKEGLRRLSIVEL
jgi:hypothetical protein